MSRLWCAKITVLPDIALSEPVSQAFYSLEGSKRFIYHIDHRHLHRCSRTFPVIIAMYPKLFLTSNARILRRSIGGKSRGRFIQ